MSAPDELDVLAEAAGLDPATGDPVNENAAAPEGEAEAVAEVPALAEPSDEFTGMVSFGVGMIGNVICERCRVATLSEAEVSRIGGAAAKVAAYYGLQDKTDPRVIAWGTLAFAVASVAGPRVQEYRERQVPAISVTGKGRLPGEGAADEEA